MLEPELLFFCPKGGEEASPALNGKKNQDQESLNSFIQRKFRLPRRWRITKP